VRLWKILWVEMGDLVPLDSGGKIGTYQKLKELAPRHAVTRVYLLRRLSQRHSRRFETILAQNTVRLARMARSWGLRGLIRLLRETCSGPWLDATRIRLLLASACQIRLE
jgi:hypothetical protein